MSHRRSPRRLALSLDRAQREWIPDTPLARLQVAWADAAGPGFTDQAMPQSVRGGTLTVACESSVVAQDLDLSAPLIVARLQAAGLGQEITRIRCVTTPLRGDRRPPR